MFDALLAAALLCTAVDAPPQHIRATGFRSDAGHAVVQVFRRGDAVPQHPFMTMKGAIKDGAASFDVDGLAEGDYAVIVFHDENDNGVVDHRFFVPAEPLGFSGGFILSLFSGLPTFEKLRVHLPLAASTTLDVGVR